MSLILVLLPVITQASVAKELAVECLAKNIYFEAKSQSFAGQVAVALVVLNRVMNKHYPSTICAVIYEGPASESWKTRHIPDLADNERVYYPRRDRCQFSWYCDGKSDEPKDDDAWFLSHALAFKVYYGWFEKLEWVLDAVYYHADYVQPDWATHKKHILKIKNHIFYGEPR